jgi:hypothetical protein
VAYSLCPQFLDQFLSRNFIPANLDQNEYYTLSSVPRGHRLCQSCFQGPRLVIVSFKSRLIRAVCCAGRLTDHSVLCWSISFYPQILMNIKRKSVHGLAIDFPALNVLGFLCYTASSASFLWSSTVRDEYARRNPASPEPTVRFNDFAFAFHALVLCLITYSQFFPSIWGFSVGSRQRASRVVLGILVGSVFAIVIVVFLAATHDKQGSSGPSRWEWIEVVSLS